MPPFDPAKLLDLSRWLDAQPGPASSWYTILGAIFSIAIAIGIYLVWLAPHHYFRHDRYHARLARNIGQGILWIAGIGLIVVVFRLLDVGFFGMRLWLLLDAIVGIALIVYVIHYLRTVYPKRRAGMERQRRKQAYQPKKRR
ncbi:MAG: hypothetical protein U0556_05555 [Dehalococcoidia bacterium]